MRIAKLMGALAAASCALLPLMTAAAGETETRDARRPLEVSDIFRVEGLGRYYGGPVAFAGDGRIAFTQLRAKQTLRNFKQDYLWDNEAGDVAVQIGDAAAVNVTQGERDGSGWWAPEWSPDGRYLAMLSTRGDPVGGNVWLWVWDSHTNELRRVSDRGVELATLYTRPYAWLDARHLLCPLLPEGEQPTGLRLETQTARAATAAWPKVLDGKQTTVSVLDSGVSMNPAARAQGQLVRIDVVTAAGTTVANQSTSSWQVSPQHRYVAYAKRIGIYAPTADQILRQSGADTFTLEISDLQGRHLLSAQQQARDVIVESLRWSPAGDRIAFLGFDGPRDGGQKLFIGHAASGRVDVVDLGALDTSTDGQWWIPAQIEWTGDNRLLLRGVERVGDRKPEVDARRDWWLVGFDGKRRNLTRDMRVVPDELWPQEGRRAFVGLADGEIWRLRPGVGAIEPMTREVDARVEQIVWPMHTNFGDQYAEAGAAYAKLIFAVRDGEHLVHHRLDLRSGDVSAIRMPDPGAKVIGAAAAADLVAFQHSDREGLRVWATAIESGRSRQLLHVNTFLRDIAEGEYRPIEYTSLDGEPLKGWIILPVGYESGKRYPLVTSVYAGAVYDDVRPVSEGLGEWLNVLSMQIPAARGYAVLLPSMPLNPQGKPDDPMLRLPNGVLPAVDKAVALGIADPQRLYLMGQSFGGFSTYGLVTQTNRFAAAVSLAGLSNLISMYSQFDARTRYGEFPQEALPFPGMFESGQVSMGAPPWKDLNRYLRNSPIFFVDRVHTPLMIVQGDMDYVALQQGEEFFTSLYRQGKRARFVRYWGEGHVLRSPANVADMWERIFSWFEQAAAPAVGQGTE